MQIEYTQNFAPTHCVVDGVGEVVGIFRNYVGASRAAKSYNKHYAVHGPYTVIDVMEEVNE